MNHRSLRALVAPMVFVIAGCSSSPPEEGSDGPPPTSTGNTINGDKAVTAARPDWSKLLDTAHPLLVQATPGARCNVHRRGANPQTGNAEPSGNVSADADGKVRFFAPPKSWGAQFEVDCDGTNTQHVSINLNDPSTYRIDEDIVNKPAEISVRPALTGDLQAIPLQDIVTQGYPPRPDAKRNPAGYEHWVSIVSSPRTVRKARFIAAPGRQAANYSGTADYYEVDYAHPWAGRAYDVAGWHAPTGNPVVDHGPNANSDWYIQYASYMLVPSTTCPTNDYCEGYEWAGMGGMEGADLIGDGSLIQSGIYLQSTASPVLFAEYAPDAPYLNVPGSFTLSAGDIIETWGWLSTSAYCDDFDVYQTGKVGCFNYYNDTTNEYYGYDYGYIIPYYDYSYYGYTFESIFEKVADQDLINFDYVNFQDSAYTVDGYYHDVTTDPWIFINAFSGSNQVMGTINGDGAFHFDDYAYDEVEWANYH